MKEISKADKKYILATIHAAAADCYQQLEKRFKIVMRDSEATAAKEIVTSGAGSIARFEEYLIQHLQLEEEDYKWRMD